MIRFGKMPLAKGPSGFSGGGTCAADGLPSDGRGFGMAVGEREGPLAGGRPLRWDRRGIGRMSLLVWASTGFHPASPGPAPAADGPFDGRAAAGPLRTLLTIDLGEPVAASMSRSTARRRRRSSGLGSGEAPGESPWGRTACDPWLRSRRTRSRRTGPPATPTPLDKQSC